MQDYRYGRYAAANPISRGVRVLLLLETKSFFEDTTLTQVAGNFPIRNVHFVANDHPLKRTMSQRVPVLILAYS